MNIEKLEEKRDRGCKNSCFMTSFVKEFFFCLGKKGVLFDCTAK